MQVMNNLALETDVKALEPVQIDDYDMVMATMEELSKEEDYTLTELKNPNPVDVINLMCLEEICESL